MVHGTVARGFEPVRDTFARILEEMGETGAGFHAIAGGRTVADLWGGDGYERGALVHVYSVTQGMGAFCVAVACYDPHPLVHVYSVTKVMAAFCVLVLVERGQLALEDRVAEHWPEFA